MKKIALIITTAATSISISLHAQVDVPEARAVKITKAANTVSSNPIDRKATWWKKRHLNQVKNANTNTAKTQLVFIGDSITQGWEGGGKDIWAKHFTKWNALNLGISGDQTQHVLWRHKNGAFPEGLKPKVAVVMIGTNNTGNKQPAAETAAAIELIIDDLHARSPETQVILHAIFPRGPVPNDKLRLRNDEINKEISKLGDRDYVHYLDINFSFLDDKGIIARSIMPDRLHPNTAGYQIWADNLVPEIKRLIKEPVISKNGYTAKFIRLEGEGEGKGKTEIWKEGKLVTTIADAKPILFSPVDDILLVAEHTADDDSKHYLLNIAKGELAKKGNRQNYVFGSRYVTEAEWSEDGTTITLTNAPEMTDKDKETFKVADLLKRK